MKSNQLKMDMGIYESGLRKGPMEKESLSKVDYTRPKVAYSLPSLATPRGAQADLLKMAEHNSLAPTVYQSNYQLSRQVQQVRLGPRPNETGVLRQNCLVPNTLYKDTIGQSPSQIFQRQVAHDPSRFKPKQSAFQLNLPFIGATTQKKAFQGQKSRVENRAHPPLKVSESLLAFKGQYQSNYNKQHGLV